jgi:hypothetical protein
MRMRSLRWASAAFALAIPARPQETPKQTDTPAAQPSPTPSPSAAPRLRLDIEKHAQRVLDEKGVPRFETTVDVEARSPQSLFDRHFEGLPCGAVGGVPTETTPGRPATSPSADFLALARALGGTLKPKGPERFFLYRIREGERVRHSLREGPVPREWLGGVNGALYELVAAFRDRGEAVRALHRLESGAEAKERPSPCPPSK